MRDDEGYMVKRSNESVALLNKRKYLSKTYKYVDQDTKTDAYFTVKDPNFQSEAGEGAEGGEGGAGEGRASKEDVVANIFGGMREGEEDGKGKGCLL